MSTDTLLKKDFQQKDVQRLRNLISKNYGNKTRDQVGYVKHSEDHEEGDVWEENNKTWTIKNGIRQTYTKLDEVRHAYRLPLVCPKCKQKMGSSQDKKLFAFHKMCFNCVVSYESQLKLEGKYEEYAKTIMKNNAYSFVEEAKDFISDFASNVEGSYYTEDGEKENWQGVGAKDKIIDKLTSELDELKTKIDEV